MAETAKLAKQCVVRRCPNKVASPRAKFCKSCFIKQARKASKKRKIFNGGKGVVGNKGNKSGTGVVGNKGNKSATGVVDNTGNTTVGKQKVAAGKRSGLRQRASIALIIKKEWLKKIFDHEKTGEIRGSPTSRRGLIHLAQPGALLVGSATISDCTHIARKDFVNFRDKHCIPRLSMVTYSQIWAWHLQSARKYKKPFRYIKPHGAIIWAYPKTAARKG